MEEPKCLKCNSNEFVVSVYRGGNVFYDSICYKCHNEFSIKLVKGGYVYL